MTGHGFIKGGAIRWVTILLLIALIGTTLPASQPRARAISPHSVVSDQAASQSAASDSGPISYIYDALGRIRAAVDPTSDIATYKYDAVGNILSIARHPSSQVLVVEFGPDHGPAGITVTI